MDNRLKQSVTACSLLIVLLGLTAKSAIALECIHEAPASDKALDVDTSLGIGAIKKLFGEANITVNVRSKQVEVYSKYPKADQLVMNDNFAFMICTSLRDDKSLSESQRTESLLRLRREIFAPAVAIPQLPTPAHPKPPTKALTSAKTKVWVGSDQEYRTAFLKQPPSVITDENSFFVIAGSPQTEKDTDMQYKDKVAAHPNIDFSIYAPYDSNTYYSLMMGTWLSESEANRVIQIATQLGLQPKPYLWRCKGRGLSC
jgi:hypothetical protein